MKRTLAFVLIFTMLLGLLCACAKTPTANDPASTEGGTQTQEPAENAGGEAVSLTLLTRCLNDSSATYNVLWEREKAWAEAHPEITITDNSVFEAEQFNNKFKICVANGEMPDLIFSYGGPAFKTYVDNGLILDLMPYIEKDPELKAWYDSFQPSALSTVTYSDVDGLYGMPIEMFATGLYYNKAIFEENGLTPPTTIGEFEEVCEALLAKGIQPMTIGDKSVYRGGHFLGELFAKRFGGEYFTKLQSGEMKFTDSEVKELFELVKKWQDKGYFGEGLTTIDQETERTMFASGETAMLQMALSYLPSIVTATDDAGVFPSEQIGFVAFPYFEEYPENQNVWHGGPSGVLSVSASSSEAQILAALDLIRCLTNQESSEQRSAVNGSFISCVKDVSLPDDMPQAAIEFHEVYANMTGCSKEPGEAYTGTVLSVFRDQVQAMLAGTDIDTVLATIQTAADESLAEQ